jgi:hypothetical protein
MNERSRGKRKAAISAAFYVDRVGTLSIYHWSETKSIPVTLSSREIIWVGTEKE